MAKLIFKASEDEVDLRDGSPIAESCEQAGVPFACSGGLCGTCIVRVIEGMENLTPPTQQEIDFLGTDGVQQERMACQCSIESGTVVLDL